MLKRTLLGATALVAAGSISPAFAGTPPTLKIGGFYDAVVVFGDDGVPDTTSVTFENFNALLNFKIEGVADNGLTYGARIDLYENSYRTDRIKESWAYLQGAFGRIEFGYTKGVGAKMGYKGPAPDGAILELSSPDYFPGGSSKMVKMPYASTVASFNVPAKRAVKINYFTPRISDVQFGLSYTPHGCSAQGSSGGAFGYAKKTDCNYSGGFENKFDGDARQTFEAGLNFDHQFEGVQVRLSGTYSYSQGPLSVEDHDHDMQAFNLGTSLAFDSLGGKITAGGQYQHIYNYGYWHSIDVDMYQAGVQYALDKWLAGVEAIYGDWNAPSHVNDGMDQKIFGLSAGLGYQLAEGLQVSAGYEHYSYSTKHTGTGDPDDANIFLIGTRLTF